jgi:hypoxia up-regulated 1
MNNNVKVFSCFVLFICILSFSQKAEPALLGIDLGTEWFKVLLMETKSFDIVLNDQSGRKTKSIVAFTRDDERMFGAPAATLVSNISE